MRFHRALVRLWIVALGLVIAMPAQAGLARAAGQERSARSSRRPKPVAAARRAIDLPKVTIGGIGLVPSESTGRRAPAQLTRDEATGAAIEAILRGPLRYGTTGLYVVDASSGRELFAVHPDDPLNPASNVKLISTATALDLLGPEFRYRTRVFGPVQNSDGVIAGDVYLLGSYDPTLGLDGLKDLAQQLAASGVTQIDGNVVVSDRSSRDGLWRSNIGLTITATKPGRAPLVTVASGYDFAEIVTTATTGKRPRVRRGLTVKSKLVTHDDGRVRLRIVVAGSIGKGKVVQRAVATTARYFHAAHHLRAAMHAAGIALGGEVRTGEFSAFVSEVSARGYLPIELARRESATLATIVAQVNKRSINWLADRVVATATALTNRQTPSMKLGIDAMYSWLSGAVGVPRTGLLVDSGSGLSQHTEFSPRQIVQVVRTATGLSQPDVNDPERTRAYATAFRNSLSIAGVDGTLRGRFRTSDLRGRVLGKTGTLARVVALSGLLDGQHGGSLAFALVSNGHSPRRKLEIRRAHEQILEILDRYLSDIGGASATAATAPDAEVLPELPATVVDSGAAPLDDDDSDPALAGDDLDDDSTAGSMPTAVEGN